MRVFLFCDTSHHRRLREKKKHDFPSPPRKSHQSETGKGESSWKLRASILRVKNANRNSLSKLTPFGTGGEWPPSSFFKSWPFDPPNGGHVFTPTKVTAMGQTRSRLEEPGWNKYMRKFPAWICGFGLIHWKKVKITKSPQMVLWSGKKWKKNSFKQSQVCQSYCVHSGVLDAGNYYLVTPKKNISTESDLQSLLLKNPKFS